MFRVMATDLADLRQTWWSMAVVCAVGGRETKVNFIILDTSILYQFI